MSASGLSGSRDDARRAGITAQKLLKRDLPMGGSAQPPWALSQSFAE